MTATGGPSTQELISGVDVVGFYEAHLPGIVVNGHTNVKVKCPFGCGDDKSFSVNRDTGLYYCHRCGAKGSPWGFLEQQGMTTERIVETLTEFQRFGTATTTRPTKPPLGPIVATYDYVDEQGNVLFQTTRHDPKDFRQRRRGTDGEWIWNLDGVRRVLYGLPGLVEAVKAGWTIYIVEGEKDADAINGLESGGEFYATTSPMGAKTKWRPEFNIYFAGADVVIVADSDEPGRQHALDIRHHLRPVAKSVRIVEAKTGKDVSDHLQVAHTLAELVPMTEPGQPEAADVPERRWKSVSIAAMVRAKPQPIDFLVDKILAVEDVTVLSGPPKSTKSWFTSALEADAALGRKVLGCYAVPRPLRILHVDEEMGEAKIRRRFQALARGNHLTAAEIDDGLEKNILMFPQQGMEFASDEGLDELRRTVDEFQPNVVVFDSFAAFTSDADERDNSARRRFYNRVLAPLKAAYKLGIIVLGHPPLPSQNAPADSQKRVRGGGDLLGTCDRSLYLTKDSEEANAFGKIVRATLGEYVAREGDGLDGPQALSLEDVDVVDGQRATVLVAYGGAGVSALEKKITLVNGAQREILHALRTISAGPVELYQPDLKKDLLGKGYSEDVYQDAVNALARQTPPLVKITDARSGRSGKWVELLPEDDR